LSTTIRKWLIRIGLSGAQVGGELGTVQLAQIFFLHREFARSSYGVGRALTRRGFDSIDRNTNRRLDVHGTASLAVVGCFDRSGDGLVAAESLLPRAASRSGIELEVKLR